MSLADPQLTPDEKKAENAQPTFSPTGYMEVHLRLNAEGQAASFNDDPVMRKSGKKEGKQACPVTLVFVTEVDHDSVNKEGAIHREQFWLDVNEDGEIDTEDNTTAMLLGILKRYAQAAFGSRDNYPVNDDGSPVKSFVALREHGALATAGFAVAVKESDKGYTQVKLQKKIS